MFDVPGKQQEAVFHEWVTEDYFRHQFRETEAFNQLTIQSNAIARHMGEEPKGELTEHLQRSDISTREKCTEVYAVWRSPRN